MIRHTVILSTLFSLAAPVAFGASIAEDMRKSWSQQKAILVRTVDAMPEESFDSKPTPEQHTFGERVLHISGANGFLLGFADPQAPRPDISKMNFKTFGQTASTKAEILSALEESFDRGIAAMEGWDDDAILEEVTGPPWVGKVTRAGLITFVLNHNMDIYGQLVVYLRLEGVTPPASRRR